MTATLRGISIDGREATETAESIEYRYVARVFTDDKNDGPEVVKDTAGLPAIGDFYNVGNDFDPSAIVISKEPRQLESPTEWEVEIIASTDVDTDPAQEIENPLLRPAIYSYGFTTRQVDVPGYWEFPSAPDPAGDYAKTLMAPNGEPFFPTPKFELDEPTLTIQKNYGSLPALLAINNTVNQNAFQGANSRQLRLRASARSNWHKNVGNYWEVTFVFTFRFETWDIQVPNIGTYFWEGGTPTDPGTTAYDFSRKVKRAEGRPIVVNLTTSGDIVTSGNEPTYTRVRVYREVDYNSLGI